MSPAAPSVCYKKLKICFVFLFCFDARLRKYTRAVTVPETGIGSVRLVSKFELCSEL